ncbi:ergothioneine biosynthesis glutamate--cysteine ligase EgtA [Marinactinospora thermotolerans]|uniref:Glutamate--cysteine ligase EgtA n=1 Tax=Marinactinospora thermotolerans DSM 45154 TaxID=1122192 RepID=A0A1T4RKW6_9ACTN|nr:ergothioneine biosynthesis glutamate--cysteine ligase EgtA [Marinactinospora thermotolerans]SKA16603.1 glutamate--cysteine ligase [Marinactinospora thermotolerans DSM 45154]
MGHITETDVHDYINGICFKTGPPGRVGVEAEWLVTDPARPHEPVPIDLLSALVTEAGPLPGGSAVSYEPGGQLELSSPPCVGPAATYAALARDLDHVAAHLEAAGLRLRGAGLDPVRDPVRQLSSPRYNAMAHYFAAGSPTGRTMMCSTASLQVCLDIGADSADAARRWRLAHRLGPVFVAAFANSPLWRGRPTGWKSTRWAVWTAIDPSRTAAPCGAEPATAWAGYALDARVMSIREAHGAWTSPPGLTFRAWLAGRHSSRPTLDDLAHHLSTLFPPVRPRGWLELRMIDALPRRWWPVPAAVAAALLDDPHAAAVATKVTAELWDDTPPSRADWLAAARDGLAAPALAACARACFAAAVEALPALGAGELVPIVDAYRDRFVERDRCPADDMLIEERA